MALAGGIALLGTTLLTERASRDARAGGQRAARAARAAWSKPTAATARPSSPWAWATPGAALEQRQRGYLAAVERSSDIVGSYGSISKVLRLLLQSAILGLGAYLVIRSELTAGAMIAASIMMARALAPIETAIANWRGFIAARDSIRRLSDVLARVGDRPGPHRAAEAAAALRGRGRRRRRPREPARDRRQRPLPPGRRRSAGRHRAERVGQNVAGAGARRHLAAGPRRGAHRRRHARAMGPGTAGPKRRLPVARRSSCSTARWRRTSRA